MIHGGGEKREEGQTHSCGGSAEMHMNRAKNEREHRSCSGARLGSSRVHTHFREGIASSSSTSPEEHALSAELLTLADQDRKTPRYSASREAGKQRDPGKSDGHPREREEGRTLTCAEPARRLNEDDGGSRSGQAPRRELRAEASFCFLLCKQAGDGRGSRVHA